MTASSIPMVLFSFPSLLALLAAVASAVAVDVLAIRRGEAPGFTPPAPAAGLRRVLAAGLLAAVLYLGVFLAFALPVDAEALDPSKVSSWELFSGHLSLAVVLVAWGMLAYAAPARVRTAASENRAFSDGLGEGAEGVGEGAEGVGEGAEGVGEGAQGVGEGAEGVGEGAEGVGEGAQGEGAEGLEVEGLGRRLLLGFRLAEERLLREIGVGIVVGIAIWAAVLLAVGAVGALLYALGADEWLPQGVPPMVTLVAAQPFWVRVLASLSAGLVEEVFFRGFLQPRIGIALSTLLFVLAHWSYGEPFMLVGVTLLSLSYAALARWRRSVWAAVAAHAVFDAVQLLVLIPMALKTMDLLETSGEVALLLPW